MISKITNNNVQINSYKVAFKSNDFCGMHSQCVKEKEKTNLPIVLLGAMAFGISAYAIFKGKKAKLGSKNTISEGLRQVQMQLKNIFGRDFSTAEVEDLTRRYIEIDKVADNKEFCKILFEQLKKDFKVENKNLNLVLIDRAIPVENGVYNGYVESLTRYIGMDYTNSREKVVKTLFHEFRHVKQNELMYRADSSKLIGIKALELEKSNNDSYKQILRMFNGDKIKAKNYIKENIQKVYQENWGHLTPLPKTSEEYRRALKYLENEANRIPSGEHYYEQILEKEAQFVGEAAGRLFEIIKKTLG